MKILTRWRNFKNIKKELKLRPGNAASDKKAAKKPTEPSGDAKAVEQSRGQTERDGQ